MVLWESERFTNNLFSEMEKKLNSGLLEYRKWTIYKPNADLFYANGTISFNQIN